MATLRARAPQFAASAAYAWLDTAPSGSTGATIRSYIDKVPTLVAIGKPATHGMIAAFAATKTSGRLRQVLDLFAIAALHRASYNLGASQFDVKKAASLSGAYEDMGGDDDISGAIDIDEAAGLEDY